MAVLVGMKVATDGIGQTKSKGLIPLLVARAAEQLWVTAIQDVPNYSSRICRLKKDVVVEGTFLRDLTWASKCSSCRFFGIATLGLIVAA